MVVPAVSLEDEDDGEVMLRGANGVMARLDPEGHDEINPAARVNTDRIPRGVSKAEGTAATCDAARTNV